METTQTNPAQSPEIVPSVSDQKASLEAEMKKVSTPTVNFVVYDKNNPPPKGLDCFGQWYLAEDIACEGDKSNPNDTGCISKKECAVRTKFRLSEIEKALSAGSSTGNISNVTKTYTPEEIMAVVKVDNGLVVSLRKHGNSVGVSWKNATGEERFVVIFEGSSKRQRFHFYGKVQYDGGKWNDAIKWFERTSPSDEGISLIQAFVQASK